MSPIQQGEGQPASPSEATSVVSADEQDDITNCEEESEDDG